MKKLVILLSGMFVLAACSSEGSDDSGKYESPSEVEQGIVSREQSKVFSNLSVESERVVENYEKLDGVRINNDDIEVTKIQDVTDLDGNEYTNNFRITGDYAYEGETAEFSTTISYKEDDFNSGFSILFYMSEPSGTLVDVEVQ